MNNFTVCFLVQNTIPTLFKTFKFYCSFVRKYVLGSPVTMFLKFVANMYTLLLHSTSANSKVTLQLNSLAQLPLFSDQCRNNTFHFPHLQLK